MIASSTVLTEQEKMDRYFKLVEKWKEKSPNAEGKPNTGSVEQRTEGPCSPATAGTDGNVTITCK
jgi:hypothetical protein